MPQRGLLRKLATAALALYFLHLLSSPKASQLVSHLNRMHGTPNCVPFEAARILVRFFGRKITKSGKYGFFLQILFRVESSFELCLSFVLLPGCHRMLLLPFRISRAFFLMLGNQKWWDPRVAEWTSFIACCGCHSVFLYFLSWSWGVVFRHGVLSVAEFEMEGQLAPEERSGTEGTRFIVHVLGEELVLLCIIARYSLYLLH